MGFPGLTGDRRGPLEGNEARWTEMDEARWEGSGAAVDSVPGSVTPARCASSARVTTIIVTIARPGWQLPGGAPCGRWAAPERRRLARVALTSMVLI
jgi:hypothetical protein